jgi:hypothetical protein
VFEAIVDFVTVAAKLSLKALFKYKVLKFKKEYSY